MTLTTVPVQRGFSQVSSLLELANRHNAFIAGGYVRWMCSTNLNPSPAGDIDLFASDEDSVNALYRNLDGVSGYTMVYDSDIAITLENGVGLPTVQIIKPIEKGIVKTTGTLEEVVSNFDFTVVRVGLVSSLEAIADPDFLANEADKILRLRVINSPIQALIRANKYAGKGYFLPPSEAIKLFVDWDQRTPEFRDRLIDFCQRPPESDWSREEIEEGEETLRYGWDDDDDDDGWGDGYGGY